MVALSGNGVVSNGTGSGAFTFTVYGYMVTGVLTGASVTHGGIVQMLMTIDQTIPIANGTVHITGNGAWSGTTDLQNLNGQINNVQGSVQACVLQTCQNAAFTGGGTWSGTMVWSQTAGSQASGTFQGTLNFSGSQVNQTGPIPVSGNWTASFAV